VDGKKIVNRALCPDGVALGELAIYAHDTDAKDTASLAKIACPVLLLRACLIKTLLFKRTFVLGEVFVEEGRPDFHVHQEMLKAWVIAQEFWAHFLDDFPVLFRHRP